MERQSLYFTAPGPDQLLVRTLLSAISPGTELLIYRGEFPQGLPVDENIPALSGQFTYPLKYGYAAVGQVLSAGSAQEADEWEGRLVFSFHPHEGCFLANPAEVLPLPQGIEPEDAVFLPNMETAVNFVMDGAPLIGERVAVFGQGIVGLLTAALLGDFPLAALVTLDRYELRRKASLQNGAQASLNPDHPQILEQVKRQLQGEADLSFELSGSPVALDQALAVTGFAGRVVIGSWYGQKRAQLDLGGRFHRSRIRLISSQVSSLAPELTGRWSKERRFETAWQMIRQIRPSRFITHRFPLEQAGQAYALLDKHPEQAIQVVFQG
jgi:2-desacetyl-2-hydroxyethyl bacteriochlorophyllide A dehydrogenase